MKEHFLCILAVPSNFYCTVDAKLLLYSMNTFLLDICRFCLKLMVQSHHIVQPDFCCTIALPMLM